MNKFMMRQARELEAQLTKAQEELASATVEVSVGGGAIKIVMNGQQEVKQVKLSPEMIDFKDTELLEELILTAVNEAVAKSQEMAQNKLASVTGRLGLPGMPKLR